MQSFIPWLYIYVHINKFRKSIFILDFPGERKFNSKKNLYFIYNDIRIKNRQFKNTIPKGMRSVCTRECIQYPTNLRIGNAWISAYVVQRPRIERGGTAWNFVSRFTRRRRRRVSISLRKYSNRNDWRRGNRSRTFISRGPVIISCLYIF